MKTFIFASFVLTRGIPFFDAFFKHQRNGVTDHIGLDQFFWIGRAIIGLLVGNGDEEYLMFVLLSHHRTHIFLRLHVGFVMLRLAFAIVNIKIHIAVFDAKDAKVIFLCNAVFAVLEKPNVVAKRYNVRLGK